jgi:DNA-directed RNA polymerase specialized sigma24 family protein
MRVRGCFHDIFTKRYGNSGEDMPSENNPIAWLEEYGDRLYRFARARVRDSFAAEDLIQETLLAAYRSREKYSGRSTVSTWLTGILKHKHGRYS